MKNLGKLQDKYACEMVYNLHTDSPILKEHEKRQIAILDANYLKVDIDIMVNEDLCATVLVPATASSIMNRISKAFAGFFLCV
jgi:hypothetical protein